MGIKSDAEILQSLQDHRASLAGDSEPADTSTDGVGEAIAELDEDFEQPESEEEDEESESEEEDSDEEESGTEAEEEDDDEQEIDDDEPEEEDDSADKEIARIQQAEKEAKERISAQVEELKSKQAEVDERLAKAEELEAKQAKSSKRFKSAPVAVAKSHGLETHQDFIDLGAKLYKYGKGISPDAKPEHKQWAQSIEREGEQESSVDELRAEIKALREERDSERKQKDEESETSTKEAAATETLNEFADGIVAKASDAYPVAAKIIESATEEERRTGIIGVATYLAEKSGKPPTAKQIFEEIETEERARLTRLGIDPDERFPRGKTKDKPGSASKKKKAPVNKQSKSKEKPPRQKTDAEILESLKKRREERRNA